MDCTVIDFLPEHLIGFEDIEGGLRYFNQEKSGEIHKKLGPCASVMTNGKIVCCLGIHLYWVGTGESWLSLRQGCSGPHVFKAALRWLEDTIEKYALDRVSGLTLCEGKFERTAKFFGFRYECHMRKYGPNGVDRILWARIR